MQEKKFFFLKLIVAALAVILVVQGFVWTRYKETKVYDGEDEFNPSHEVEPFWDDELDKEILYSWSRRDISESFMMRAASWEAIDKEWDDGDQRDVIFVNSSREPCAA